MRIAEGKDYQDIIDLLGKHGFDNAPTEDELFSGIGIVEEIDDKIVGFIWALVSCKMAFIDYLCVDEQYRYKAECGRSAIGLKLASTMFSSLTKIGVTKFAAIISDRKESRTMLQFYRDNLGMSERSVLAVVNGKPESVYDRLTEVCHD